MRTALLLCSLMPLPAFAADSQPTLAIEGHRFVPETLAIPAGKQVRLTVDNRDPTPEEFESHALNREKIIPGKSKASIYIGPLERGRYPFIGEFNEATAQGAIVVQ